MLDMLVPRRVSVMMLHHFFSESLVSVFAIYQEVCVDENLCQTPLYTSAQIQMRQPRILEILHA